MKNVLKASIIRNNNVKGINSCKAQTMIVGEVNSENIIDELLKDGLSFNRQLLLDIILQYNTKAAEMVMSGYNVNTGLIKMDAEIKGSVPEKRWNTDVNKIEVSFQNGDTLLQAINKTTVEIMEEEIVQNDSVDTNQIESSQINAFVEKSSAAVGEKYLKIENDVPACGIAFRRWLCNA